MSSTPTAPHLLIVCDYSMRYLGGAQTALVRQANALVRNGVRVTVLAPGASEITMDPSISVVEPPLARTLPVVQLPLHRRTPFLERWVATLVTQHEITAVMVHSEFGLTATAAVVAKRLSLPVLHTVHTFFWRAPWAAAPFAPLLRRLYRRLTGFSVSTHKLTGRPFDSALRQLTRTMALHADVVVSPSAHQAARLEAAGVPNVAVLSNVTESSSPTLPAPPTQPLTLAWIGRFAPEKRLPQAVAGVCQALDRLGAGRVELRIAGATPGRSLLAQTRNRPEVHWLGRLDSDEVTTLIDHSHAVLLTSLGFDNQPMTVLESFSRARPVVLVDPVLEREFEGAALLTDSPEAAGIAATLCALAEDPDALATATAAASRFAERTTMAAHAAAVFALVEKVTSERITAR